MSETVLVVDDRNLNLELIEAYLEGAGLEVRTAFQGELWKAPLIAQGQQKDFVGTVQLTYFLHSR